MEIFIGILIPFVGTALGAACVFLLRQEIRPMIQKALLGFASGVMVAASVWSLLIPVSYTHLDVYKRQGQQCDIFICFI